MKKIVTAAALLFLLCYFKAGAQSYEVPKDYHFKTNDDYAKYEAEIIKTADWMQQTPWTAQLQKQDAASQFFLSWIKGTPAVTIKLTETLMSLSDKNPQLGFTYMAQFSKYALLHKPGFDNNKATVEALKAVIAKYKSEPTHKKDNNVEDLIRIDKEGRLDAWVATDFYTE